MNFQGIIVILMPPSITLSFYRQQKYVREGLIVRSAQKHFEIKFINIAIYCNTLFQLFDIAIYRNTFLALLVTTLSRYTRIYCIVTLILTVILKIHIFHFVAILGIQMMIKTLLYVVLIIYLIVV